MLVIAKAKNIKKKFKVMNTGALSLIHEETILLQDQ